jgi:hypothetical protein
MSSGIIGDVMHLAMDFMTGNFAGLIGDVMGLMKDLVGSAVNNAMQQSGVSQQDQNAFNNQYNESTSGLPSGTAAGQQALADQASGNSDVSNALKQFNDAVQSLIQAIQQSNLDNANSGGKKGNSAQNAAAANAGAAGTSGGGGGGVANTADAQGAQGAAAGATGSSATGSTGSTTGVNSFFMALAEALGNALQNQANKVKQLADKVNGDNANTGTGSTSSGGNQQLMKDETLLNGASQEMNFMANSVNTALSKLGDALTAVAHPV